MRLIIGIILLFVSQPLFAANTYVDINSFKLWTSTFDADVVRVRTSEPISNPENCIDPDSDVVGTQLSEKVKDRIYSTLLAANMAKKTIRVVSNGCEDNRPKINTVIIE